MKKILYLILFMCAIYTTIHAQQDSTLAVTDTTSSINLLDDLTLEEEMPLLPEKMIPTQRLLWGKKGVMRYANYFSLTPEKRQRELKIRRFMLGTHQVLGFTTLAGMVAQGIVGAQLYKGNYSYGNNNQYSMKSLHEGLAVTVNSVYFTTAGLALFAPPKMISDKKGYSSIKVHKWLACIHLTGMLATNGLALFMEDYSQLKPYHRAAAFTSFAAFAASMIIIKF